MSREERLHFDAQTLPNGITVYSHAMDVPFFSIYVQAPVGSVNSHKMNPGGMPGIAHFLEHMLFNRSKLYPEKDSFNKLIRFKGSYWNATTYARHTEVYVDAPFEIQEEVVEGLLDHFINPIFTEEDAGIERTVVANERNQRRYYPAKTELGEYLYREWMFDVPYSKEQLFGSDDDLKATTHEHLTTFMKSYFTPGTRIVVGGGHNLAPILEAVAKIPTEDHSLIEQTQPARWTNREFHTKEFEELQSPIYYLGGITSSFSNEESYALGFALKLLTNSVHGPLYDWTRKKKGWTYGISFNKWISTDRTAWQMRMPLNEPGRVDDIRGEIHDRIVEAFQDPTLISREAERLRCGDLFSFQTLDDRMDSALGTLRTHDRIVTEREYLDLLEKSATSDVLMKIYEKYMAPSVLGEFMALPK